MKTIILPFIVKRQKGKLTRLAFNENQYQSNFNSFSQEIREIYNSIPNMEVSFSQVLSDILQSNFSENHYQATICGKIKVAFVNINKIPAFHSIESIGASLLKN